MNFNSIQDAWKYGIDAVLSRGEEVEDERGDTTLELSNLVMTIDKPLEPILFTEKYCINNPVTDGLWSNPDALEPYIREFLEYDCNGFVYTYGDRIHNHFDMDESQFEMCLQRLKKCRNTRRAVISTYDPETDCYREDIPCLIMLDFKIRDSRLNTTGVWRSHDIAQAYYPNLVGVSYLVMELAEKIGVEVGSITTHSISAHIRNTDFDYAKVMVGGT